MKPITKYLVIMVTLTIAAAVAISLIPTCQKEQPSPLHRGGAGSVADRT